MSALETKSLDKQAMSLESLSDFSGSKFDTAFRAYLNRLLNCSAENVKITRLLFHEGRRSSSDHVKALHRNDGSHRF